MATYNFFVNGNSTPVGTITATFVPPAPDGSTPGQLTGVSYANQNGPAQPHSDITLNGPDQSGNYTAAKHLSRDWTVSGHNAHRHLAFTFNPNEVPQFSNGVLNDDPSKTGGFGWTASQDSPIPTAHKH
jgi:hypothetical protein